MMKQDIENKIIDLLELKSKTILHDTNILIKEIELDSIQYIQLLVEIEQLYSIEFETDKLLNSAFQYLADLVEYVVDKVYGAVE